jgi:hypothetical protein
MLCPSTDKPLHKSITCILITCCDLSAFKHLRVLHTPLLALVLMYCKSYVIPLSFSLLIIPSETEKGRFSLWVDIALQKKNYFSGIMVIWIFIYHLQFKVKSWLKGLVDGIHWVGIWLHLYSIITRVKWDANKILILPITNTWQHPIVYIYMNLWLELDNWCL